MVIPNDVDYVYRFVSTREDPANVALVFCLDPVGRGNAGTIPAIRQWLGWRPKSGCKAHECLDEPNGVESTGHG